MREWRGRRKRWSALTTQESHEQVLWPGRLARTRVGGETFYRYDAKAQRIPCHYFNSQGGYSEGNVEPAQNELRFPEERYEQGGKTMVLRTIWRFEGDAKMLAVTEQQRDGQWVEAWRIAFARE